MQVTQIAPIQLSAMPRNSVLLIQAATKPRKFEFAELADIKLPSTRFCYQGLTLDKPNFNAFHQLLDWDLGTDSVHPCYLHGLAFSLHLKLLLAPDFPFPLLGLVHLHNQIKQVRPIKKDEKLTLTCGFGAIELHTKGWLFSIDVDIYSGDSLVWQSSSSNLFRYKHGEKVTNSASQVDLDTDIFKDPVSLLWRLNANLGRRYAKVSGDYNPIHLYSAFAKLFGFKQHIIHGMWTKSRCISALQRLAPELFSKGVEINTRFKQPLYLPNQVNFQLGSPKDKNSSETMDFRVVANKAQQRVFLEGDIATL